jgi:hypothetical protein
MATENTNLADLPAVEEQQDGSAVIVLDDDGHSTQDESTVERSADAQHASEDAALDRNNDLSEEEREQIRARRREERRNKKSAQREREDNLRAELASRDAQLAEMRDRVANIEQRGTAADLAQLEQGMQRAVQSVQYYKGVIEEATKRQDGAMVADATERMMSARNEAEKFQQIRQQFTNSRTGAQPALDPQVKSRAENWAASNKWYDPSGGDQDSELVLTLDRRLAKEGYDPRTQAYWDELNTRIGRYLPHVRNSGQNGASPQERSAGTPVAGSGRESGAGSARTGGSAYQLSAARVQALKDAGVWDDAKARTEAIKRYRDYDRTHSASARS